MAAHWGHALPPTLRVCGSNAVIPSLSHLFTFCLCYAQLRDKPQIGEVPRELIQVISFMSCIDRKCFLTGSHEKPWLLWAESTSRSQDSCGAPQWQGETQGGSQPEWGLASTPEPVREQGGQNLWGSRVASVTNALICTPMWNRHINNVQVFFCFWECELPGSNIHSLSGYLIRWKFLRVQPINASIALVMRQSSFLKGFYNNQVKKNDFLFWFAINMLS